MRDFVQDSCFGADRSPREYAKVSESSLRYITIPRPKHDLDLAMYPKPGAFLDLPDYREDPGLYGVAIDLIKVCDEYFDTSKGGPPSKDDVEGAIEAFSTEFATSPLPPDHRLATIPFPASPNVTLWKRATEEVKLWSASLKASALTGAPINSPTDTISFKIISHMMRYIICLEHSTFRRTTFAPDYQPSAAVIDKYLRHNSSGVTLAALHQRFPNTTNIRELIRRAKRFCTYDHTEAKFVRKWIPTEKDILEQLDKHPATWHDLVDLFPGGVGSEEEVLSLATQLGEYDRTTGNLIREHKHFPGKEELHTILMSYKEMGITRKQAMAHFPNRVCSEGRFRDLLTKVGYPAVPDPPRPLRRTPWIPRHMPDSVEDVWFPKFSDGYKGFVSQERTKELDGMMLELWERISNKPEQFFSMLNGMTDFVEKTGVYVMKTNATDAQGGAESEAEDDTPEVDCLHGIKKDVTNVQSKDGGDDESASGSEKKEDTPENSELEDNQDESFAASNTSSSSTSSSKRKRPIEDDGYSSALSNKRLCKNEKSFPPKSPESHSTNEHAKSSLTQDEDSPIGKTIEGDDAEGSSMKPKESSTESNEATKTSSTEDVKGVTTSDKSAGYLPVKHTGSSTVKNVNSISAPMEDTEFSSNTRVDSFVVEDAEGPPALLRSNSASTSSLSKRKRAINDDGDDEVQHVPSTTSKTCQNKKVRKHG